MTTGVLLINLGTPDAPNTVAIGRYLRQFLMDKRVINLPFILRFLLVYGVIIPFRTQRSKHAYQAIWSQQGSPLRVNSHALCEQLQQRLGDTYVVALGMRYGHPSIQSALARLQGCDALIVLPLYPQYASATTGSSMEVVLNLIAKQTIIPAMQVIPAFYNHPAFIRAQADLIRPYVTNHDFILFSYHGLPEHQIRQVGCDKPCEGPCIQRNIHCYRAQCFETTAQLVSAAQVSPQATMTAFQSRLGRTPWVKPYSDEALTMLAARGVKRIAVVCPSFVADCLETLEEIGIRAAQQWQALGGDQLSLIPCLNATESWCDALKEIIQPL
jgi:ferrochelatase